MSGIGRAIQGRRGIWGYVKGGMGAVTRTAMAAARDLGVDIRTGVASGRGAGAGGVAAGWCLRMAKTVRAHAWCFRMPTGCRAFLTLTPASALPAEFRQRIDKNFRIGGTVFVEPGAGRAAALHRRPADVAPEICSRATVDIIAPSLVTLSAPGMISLPGASRVKPFIEIFRTSTDLEHILAGQDSPRAFASTSPTRWRAVAG
ncbi:MAG: hypothetical protein U0074_01030 [Kouleothrix sp.]